jgi:hypothetical protein
VTRAEAAARLPTLGTVAGRDLAVPVVIRPRRDGWPGFLPGRRAWYGTAGRRRTRCSPARTAAAYPPDATDHGSMAQGGLFPVLPHQLPGRPAQLEVSHAVRPGRSARRRRSHAR